MIELERDVPGLDSVLVRRIVARLLELEPDAVAVLLMGSYAKGTASEASDLDLTAITRATPKVDYRMWFEEDPPRSPLHVSAAAATPKTWQEKRRAPASWSLGFPAINVAHVLWSTPEARGMLGGLLSQSHPAAEPILEDFLEFVLKAKKSARLGDELGLRLFAQVAGSLAPRALLPLNEERIVSDRRDALDAALSLTQAPAGYRHDLTICLGLAAASAEEVRAAVTRLARELLAYLRQRAPDVDTQPDIARFLADGTLERHVGRVE